MRSLSRSFVCIAFALTIALPPALAACDDSSPASTAPAPAPTVSVPGADGGAPSAGGKPDLDAMLRGGDCPAVTGAGVEHRGDVTADEVWRASDGVHRVTGLVRVLANVTLEACARVQVDEGGAFEVGSSQSAGELLTQGTFDGQKLLPVTIAASDAARPWGAIVVSALGTLDLSYTAIAGGDAPSSQQNGGGMVRVFGASTPSTPGVPTVTKNIRSRWALVDGARSIGVQLLAYAGFTDDSTGLAVRRTTGPAVLTLVGAVQALPSALDLSGNAPDEVLVDQATAGVIDHTFRNLGVPYRAVDRINLQPVADLPPVTMTIEAGVTLRFGDARGSSGITVGASATRQGRIVARGTAAQPITLTSAKDVKAAGDWRGIVFQEYPADGAAFENVVFEYAGGDSSTVGSGCGPSDNDATLLILGQRPSEAWVKSSTFRFGAGQTGIVLGWTSDADGPDFKSTNTFVEMPACQVSRRRSSTGCPAGGPTCL